MAVKDPTVYGVDWPHVSWNIVFRRAGGRCECRGECGRDAAHLADDGRCRNYHGRPRWRGKPWQRPVILSAMHLDPDAPPDSHEQLLAGCEGCHLHLDRARHAETRRRHRERELGLIELF